MICLAIPSGSSGGAILPQLYSSSMEALSPAPQYKTGVPVDMAGKIFDGLAPLNNSNIS